MHQTDAWYILPEPVDPNWLAAQLEPNAGILALSIRALARLARQFEGVSGIEAQVPYAEMPQLADRAEALANEFARSACGGETIGGYDIPALAWQAQEHFFRDALLAGRLGEVWREREVAKVVWVGSRGSKPAFYLPTFDTSLIFLEEALGKRAMQLRPPAVERAAQGVWRERLRHVPGMLEREWNDRFRQPGRARVVAAFTEREWARHSAPLEHLAEAYGTGLQFWSLGHPSPALKAWAGARGIPLVWVSYDGAIDADIRAFFARQWQLWNTTRKAEFGARTGLPAGALDRLDFHFRFFFTNLWQRLAQWARKCERWLELARPEWVVASNDYVAGYALPHYAAARVGIPSVALPHTVVPQGNHPLTASFLACRHRFERMNYAESFPEDGRVWLCRDATNELSYVPGKSAGGLPDHKRMVAILTVGEDTEGAVMAKMNRTAFLETLGALLTPPAALDGVQLVIKAHPRFDVLPLLEDLGLSPAANVTLLDAKFPIDTLIERAWVVVQCNYFGSSVVQAIAAGKPVLFLDTAGHYWPGESRLAFEAGKTIESVEAFWDYLKVLCAEPEVYAADVARGRAFDRAYLTAPAHTLVERMGGAGEAVSGVQGAPAGG